MSFVVPETKPATFKTWKWMVGIRGPLLPFGLKSPFSGNLCYSSPGRVVVAFVHSFKCLDETSKFYMKPKPQMAMTAMIFE